MAHVDKELEKSQHSDPEVTAAMDKMLYMGDKRPCHTMASSELKLKCAAAAARTFRTQGEEPVGDRT